MNTTAIVAKGELTHVAVGRISPDKKQPRRHFDQAELAGLARTIKAHGLLQPIIVRRCGFAGCIPAKHNFLIVAGERRWRAAKLAGLKQLLCTVVDVDDLEALELQVVENEQRADLTPLEKAEGYARLLAQYEKAPPDNAAVKPMARLCRRLGKSEATVYDLLKLRALPPPAKRAIQNGTLTKTTANLIARLPSPAAREQAAQEVLAGKLSFRQAKAKLKRQPAASVPDDSAVPATDEAFAAPGDIVKTSYGSGPYVIVSITKGSKRKGRPTFSMVLSELNKNKRSRLKFYLNDYQLQADGRITNGQLDGVTGKPDELFIKRQAAPQAPAVAGARGDPQPAVGAPTMGFLLSQFQALGAQIMEEACKLPRFADRREWLGKLMQSAIGIERAAGRRRIKMIPEAPR